MREDKRKEMRLGSWPLLVCAPMVDQSQLPFRLLTRRYGANVCYTPMLHSRLLTTSASYKDQHFSSCPEDRPLVAQLCGNDPQTVLKAAKMLESEVDAIDLNFGCPQAIAKRGHYGAFLLEQPELMESIVSMLSKHLTIPVFCKIRLRRTEEKTMEVVRAVVRGGCALLAVHGRTKEQNKERVGACDWQMIRKIKEAVEVPVVANGGIYTYRDVQMCLQHTGADGVMSAEALLQNPALFANRLVCIDQLAKEYLELVALHRGADPSCVKAHLFKMLYKGLQQNIDLRETLAKANSIQECTLVANQLRLRRQQQKVQHQFGWYLRYWKVDPLLYQKGVAFVGPIMQSIEQQPKDQNKNKNTDQNLNEEHLQKQNINLKEQKEKKQNNCQQKQIQQNKLLQNEEEKLKN